MVTTIGMATWLAVNAVPGADCAQWQARGAPPQRVELYTSEGCSSCPPADRWWSAQADEQRLWLAFHVDYWDDLGWRDPYSDPRFGERQRRISARTSPNRVYTPEVAVEGKEYRAWRQGLPAATWTPGPALTVQLRHTGSRWSVQSQLRPAPPSASLYVALTEDGIRRMVHAGENRGLRLAHDRVVRVWVGPAAIGETLEWEPPADLSLAHARLVVWVEDAQGHTLQGLQRPLALCAGGP